MGKPVLNTLSFDPRWGRLLEELPENLDGLQRLDWLRRELSPEDARQVAEFAALRRRARGKLVDAGCLWLTRKGLEQATDARVAALRAERLRRICGNEAVVDATAGLGGDLLAMARAGLAVVGIERDPGIARLLRANLEATGLKAGVICARAHPNTVRTEWLFVDPDRRTGTGPGAGGRTGPRRTLDPRRWSPPLEELLAWLPRLRGACLKLPPALNPAALPLPPSLSRSLQWVSLEGELKELCLWTGELAAEEPRTATILRRGAREELSGSPLEVPPLAAETAETVAWIADPDPALAASGLLGRFARRVSAAPLAPELGYLGACEPDDSPAAAFYRVIDSAPLDRRRVRAMLARHDIGPIVVKKRGLQETAAKLAARLGGKGSRPGLLIAAKLERSRRVFLVRKHTN